MKPLIYTAILLSIATTGADSQQAQPPEQPTAHHTPWTKEDSAAINALALYPDSVRLEIFQACEYPSVIVDVTNLQKNSSAAFASLVSSYSKTKQEDIWNMSRYPDLISRLVTGGKKSKKELDTILASYPAEIHDVALKYGRSEYTLLKKVNDLQNQTNQQFNQIISSYPADVQKTFTDLLQLPEVLSLLNDHLSLSIRVGDRFKQDPQWVMHKSDSNAAAQAKLNAEQLQDWKQSLQQDSDAQNELKEAANQYAEDNGYTQSEVDAPIDSNEVDNTAVYPYPYWFGYPTWYPYAYWYPYPYWYDWGFCYGPYGNMRIFGFPSYYFTNWYFCRPNHWQRYPHLGSAYVHHYYGPHRSNTLSSQVVHGWVQANKSYLPAGFTKNDATRVAAMRQYGELNEKVVNKNGTVNSQARDEYFAKNSAKYPALNNNLAKSEIPEEKQVPDVRMPFTRQPTVVPQRSQSQRVQSQSSQPQRVQPERTQPQRSQSQRVQSQSTQPQRTQPRSVPQPRYNYNTIQRAQSYHSSGWGQAQPAPRSAPQPAQRAMPSAPRAMPSAPARSNGGGGRR